MFCTQYADSTAWGTNSNQQFTVAQPIEINIAVADVVLMGEEEAKLLQITIIQLPT